jgi:hypothetical protein
MAHRVAWTERQLRLPLPPFLFRVRLERGKLMERWVVSDLYGALEVSRPPSPR